MKTLDCRDYSINDINHCNKYLRLFIPEPIYEKAMNFSEDEDSDQLLAHCLFGLSRHYLITNVQAGDPEFFKKQELGMIDKGEILVAPTLIGAELFVWASGVQGDINDELLKMGLIKSPAGVQIMDGASPLGNVDELTSPTMHHSFRPPLPDLKSQTS